MGESLLLITIVTLVILTIRRAKPVVLESPVTIQRPGQYHMVLAPQLNRAQTYLEKVAQQFLSLHPPKEDISGQFYEIRDPAVFAKGESAYFLAVTLRDGMIYFQAYNPKDIDMGNRVKSLSELVDEALKPFPPSRPADAQWAENLRNAINTTAEQLGISVLELVDNTPDGSANKIAV